MLLYYPAIFEEIGGYALNGNYDYRPEYPNGQADLMHELLLHRPHLEQVVSRAVIIPVPGLDADEAESIAADVLGRIQPDALERLLALAGESIRRFVRIVDGIKQTRARRGTNGVVRLDEVDAAWRRLYPPQRGRA